ncbi:1-phosphatidylinositol 4,5-bisphosphate phosphodiesterase delta-3-A, partial [Trichinella sp. T6]
MDRQTNTDLVNVEATMRRVKNNGLVASSPLILKLAADQRHIIYFDNACFKKSKTATLNKALEVRSGWNTDVFHKAMKSKTFVTKVNESACFSIIFRHPIRHFKSLNLICEDAQTRQNWVHFLTEAIEKLKEEHADLQTNTDLVNVEATMRRVKNNGLVASSPLILKLAADQRHIIYFDNACFKKSKTATLNKALEVRSGWNTDVFHKAMKSKTFVTKVNESACFSIIFRHPIRHFKSLNLICEDAQTRQNWKSDFRKEGPSADTLDFDEFHHFFRYLTDRPDLRDIIRQLSEFHEEFFTVEDLKNFLTNIQQLSAITLPHCRQLIRRYEPELENQKSLKLSFHGLRRLLLSEAGNIVKPEHKVIYQNMEQPLTNYYIYSTHNTYLCGHQLMGDATIEGYILALKKGARLLELDIWPGENDLQVTHGHTLVKPVSLSVVLKAINNYGFSTTPYPIILSLEIHCDVRKQAILADMLVKTFGKKLHKNVAHLKTLPSPEELKNKILLKGKGGLAKELATLIAIVSAKLVNPLVDLERHQLVAMVEENQPAMVKYTSQHLVKCYPRGTRTSSTNMNPVVYWLAGIQSVCLNIQTADLANDLNTAMFSINGNCGYVLKPDCLQNKESSTEQQVKRMIVRILSANFLPKPSTTTSKEDVIDPYVKVETFGMPSDRVKYRTAVIRNNGFNPCWNESFRIDLRYADSAFLRFCIKDYNLRAKDDFIGQYTIPVNSIRPGYSYIHLKTGFYRQEDPAAVLFFESTIATTGMANLAASTIAGCGSNTFVKVLVMMIKSG